MDPLKLLIVEDDPLSLELMAEVFSNLKADVCAIGDSRQAAELISKERFDGIFVDLEMPNIPGLELARKIRYSPWNRATPIVIVTGHDERSTMKDAFATGATFFLQKPVDRQRLTGLFRTVRGAMLENRRRSVRLAMQTEVTCAVGARNLRGRSWNISRGGMQIEVGGLKFGETVRVSFRLPGSGAQIDGYGKVAWVKEDREGIRFTKLSHKNEEDIKEFMIVSEH